MGKGGGLIKELMASSGAHVKLSQPSEMIEATQERVPPVTPY